MKPLQFLGDSLKRLRDFPDEAKQDAGYQLDKVQRGEQPDDFRPMPTIGRGVEELRIGVITAHTVWCTPLAWRTPWSFCTHFKKPRKQLANKA